jgi:AraC-like DNA-binding protein
MNQVKFFEPHERIKKYVSGYLETNQTFENSDKPFFTPKGTSALTIPIEVSPNTFVDYPDASGNVFVKKHVPLLFGQMTKMGKSTLGKDFHIFVVVFSPTGIFHFIDGPATQIRDRILELSQIGMADLEKKMIEAIKKGDLPEDWVGAFDKIFLAHFSSKPEKKVSQDVKPIVDHILAKNGNVVLEELVEQNGVNTRTFQKSFKQQVGIPPKLFCRIIRFNSLLIAINSLKWDILSRAVEFGYSDNSHLYKDFKAFLGMTPRQYLSAYFKANLQVEEAVHSNVYKKV